MIDFDLSDVMLGHDGWFIKGRPGRYNFSDVPHAVNCRCDERAKALYEAHLSGVKHVTQAAELGLSSSRVQQLVDRVKWCKWRAIKRTRNAHIGMSELDALYLVDCLERIEKAARSA